MPLLHVKWFTEDSFADQPLPLADVLTPTFVALALLSFIVIGSLVFIDRRISDFPLYRQISQWLADRREHSVLVMRIATGAVLLLSWQADSLLAPELHISQAWLGWLQFLIALLLIFPQTVPVAGAGVLFLYVMGIAEFGIFYLLDYLHYAGVGYYLLTSQASQPRLQASGLPALYFSVGFSLCWVALEKLVYPEWGLYLLDRYPQLTLGFPTEFFLTSTAFVEFSLGYLLIICLLERPISLVVTLVFFTTTTIFGKTEVIGHTLIHAALIVFLLEGPGTIYKPPIQLHRNLGMRTAFAAVNFVLLLGLLLLPYTYMAQTEYERHQAEHQEEAIQP